MTETIQRLTAHRTLGERLACWFGKHVYGPWQCLEYGLGRPLRIRFCLFTDCRHAQEGEL